MRRALRENNIIDKDGNKLMKSSINDEAYIKHLEIMKQVNKKIVKIILIIFT